ncbi:MAG: glycosyltransferase family 4 protein [Firmicutes bacterium]|nr:glycosyltransferase family 4 protein [Bacillota bacterium]
MKEPEAATNSPKPLSRPINILQITKFIQGIGGMETRLLEFLKQRIPGFNFFVFALEPIPAFWRRQLDQLKIPYAYSPLKYSTAELVRFAREYRIDLSHLHHPWPEAVFELKKAGVPIIIVHDHYGIWGPPSKIRKYLEYRELTDGVITVSEAGRKLFLKRLNFDPAKVVTIHNGVDFKNLKADNPIKRPAEDLVVTSICRLEPVKGVDSLIKAVPVVRRKIKNVRFWIVGGGGQYRALMKLAQDLGVAKLIKFWGERRDIGNFLAVTDIFVLPSFREPFSGALIEAAYWAKPAIAANIDGNAEIISHNETGLLINPSIPVKSKYRKFAHFVVNGETKRLQKPKTIDPVQLGKAVIRLLKAPELRRLMGEAARGRALKLFGIERYSADLIAYYQTLLKAKGIIPS